MAVLGDSIQPVLRVKVDSVCVYAIRVSFLNYLLLSMDFDDFWDRVNGLTSPAIKERFAVLAVPLLQALMKEMFRWETIDIGLFENGNKTLALITHDPWNSDKRLSLRLHADESFDLYFECYEEDDYQTAVYRLTEADTLLIPPGLKVLMRKAIKTNRTIAVDKNTLAVNSSDGAVE